MGLCSNPRGKLLHLRWLHGWDSDGSHERRFRRVRFAGTDRSPAATQFGHSRWNYPMEAQSAHLWSEPNPVSIRGAGVSSDIVRWLVLVNRPHVGTVSEEGEPSFAKFVQYACIVAARLSCPPVSTPG